MAKKILVVDDEKNVLMVLGETLSGAGYDVIKADNGSDAIAMARGEHPDLILLDLMMPEMDGSAVAETLENDPATKDIPVIFLTGLLTKEEEKGSHIRGGKHFIAKPYDAEELLEVIGECLRGDTN